MRVAFSVLFLASQTLLGIVSGSHTGGTPPPAPPTAPPTPPTAAPPTPAPPTQAPTPAPPTPAPPTPAPSTGAIRLVDGGGAGEGRLEVFLQDQWGTVCDDSFGRNDARVVCRQLGFDPIFAESFGRARYGQGTGPILLDDVDCTGDEMVLTDCASGNIGEHNCQHTEDVGVSCIPIPTTTTYVSTTTTAAATTTTTAAAITTQSFSGSRCMWNRVPCGAGASCDAGTDRCVCDPGLAGNPRVQCVDPTRCLCTVLADPQYTLFDDQKIKANLPCSMYLLLDTKSAADTCHIVSLTAHPRYRQHDPTRTFVKQMTLKRTASTIEIVGSGINPATAPAETDVTVGNGFTTVTLSGSGCDELSIGLNKKYGGVFVDAPPGYTTGSTSGSGLCGTCNGDTSDEETGSVVGGTDNLAYALQFIATAADQRGPFAAQCGGLSDIFASDCGSDPAKLLTAAVFCDVLVSDPFASCASRHAAGFGPVITKYGQCLSLVCQDDLAGACASFNAFKTFYSNCPVAQPPGCLSNNPPMAATTSSTTPSF